MIYNLCRFPTKCVILTLCSSDFYDFSAHMCPAFLKDTGWKTALPYWVWKHIVWITRGFALLGNHVWCVNSTGLKRGRRDRWWLWDYRSGGLFNIWLMALRMFRKRKGGGTGIGISHTGLLERDVVPEGWAVPGYTESTIRQLDHGFPHKQVHWTALNTQTHTQLFSKTARFSWVTYEGEALLHTHDYMMLKCVIR